VPSFSPKSCGAQCDICPLGPDGPLRKDEWRPVGGEFHQGASVVAIAEAPGADEVQHGRPLVGRAGSEWVNALSASGKRRIDIDLDHVISCRPAGQESGAWRRMEKSLDRINRARAKKGEDPYPHPATCCRPRLLRVASRYQRVITLGKTATSALTGQSSSIQSTRGGPMYVDQDWDWVAENGVRKLLPTLHPSFILRAPSWRHVLQSDIAKAFRWFDDRLKWTKPDSLINPSPEEFDEWLAQPAPFWAYDVETDGIEPLECNLRTIAIAIPDLDENGKAASNIVSQNARAVGVGLLSTDGVTRLYPPEQEQKILDSLRRVFTDGRVWVGHNAGYYDRMVIEAHLGVTPAPLVDTLFHARFRAPDLPKGLKTIGSVLTDVERWETTEKGTKISTGSQDDVELLRYNIVDSTVNARIVVPLINASTQVGVFEPANEALKPTGWKTTRPWNLNEVDHATQEMCVGMHKSGVWVDQKLRGDLELEYRISVKKRYKKLQTLAQDVGLKSLDADSVNDLNPGSADQIRNLLYEHWGLGIPASMDAREFYTETGAPGTGDAVLRGHLASGRLSQDQESFLKELRLYRREKNKILGTVLIPLSRRDQNREKGLVHEDGRVRSTWNAHVTSVGRLSSSGPNLQNIGNRKGQGRLKKVFAAPSGRIMVGADLDQAHLRITACYWNIPRLLECFDTGKDPHNLLAYDIFGNDFKNASGWGPDGFSLDRKPSGGEAKAMRDVMKTFRYASIYWADPTTVWQVLTSTETDDGRMPYLKFETREVRHFHNKWLEAEPEWEAAWKRMTQIYDHQGYMVEPILGRRSGPLSDGKKNEVVNFPILAAESSIMRLAEQEIIDAFPFNYAGEGTGMIHQCHDSIAVEMPLPEGLPANWEPTKGEPLPAALEDARRKVEECMTVNIPGWDVTMTAEADVGRSLKDI
jgi:DNA polymerase I-like protein with 3'-5' exonuclease and polymerase domains/uracil-DNA glycosylase